MLNERLAAMQPIYQNLKLTERAMNDAMRHMGALLVEVANARESKGTRFAVDAGINACEQVTQAATCTMQGFQKMIVAHSHLATDRDNAGIPAQAFGDFYSSASKEDADAVPTNPLRVVGE